jgi:hypothetical protein
MKTIILLIVLLIAINYNTYSQFSIKLLDKEAMELSIKIGLQDLNKSEINNRGEHIKKYALSVWNKSIDGYYYCYTFQYWNYAEACKAVGVQNKLPQTGHCLTAWNKALKLGEKVKFYLEVGAKLIWAKKSGAGHAGMITKILDADKWIVQTLEANTGADARNGGYVKYCKRYLKFPLQKMLLKGTINAR